MNWGKAAAIGQIILSLTSAVGYGIVGDWRRAIYWAAAAVITGSVTF